MKILLWNRSEDSHLGGDMIHLRAYQKAINSLGGNIAEYVYDPHHSIDWYDEVWGFHCNFDWAYNAYKMARDNNKTFRLIAIFYKDVYVNISKEQVKEMYNYAKNVYFLSEQERQEMNEDLGGIDLSKSLIVPNGYDELIFNNNIKKDRVGVVSVGRLSGEKNFDKIIEACMDLNVPVTIIGAKWDEEYKNKLIAYNYADIKISLTQLSLSDVLFGKKLYVCAAENERGNLALIEGIACGLNAVSSPGNRGNEWLTGIPIADPHNKEDLKEKIKAGLESNYNNYGIKTWKQIVSLILSA